MDMDKLGWTSIAVSVSPPTKEIPKGGAYNRMEKLLLHRKEPWNMVVLRLLDYWDQGHPDGK
jgi:predicted P-loop ATPase/GTPase